MHLIHEDERIAASTVLASGLDPVGARPVAAGG
jgi:hypothetical protein